MFKVELINIEYTHMRRHTYCSIWNSYYVCAARFPTSSCLLLCLQVSSPSPFCPPSLVISSFFCLSRRDRTWAMACGSATILDTPHDHHLRLEHYEGLGTILVYCWPQVKLLVLPTTSHAQAHPPKSTVVRNGCGF